MQGLGEYPGIRRMYLDHVHAAEERLREVCPAEEHRSVETPFGEASMEDNQIFPL